VSVTSLVLYVYPALVTVGAVALGRERFSRRKALALTLSLAGVALVLLAAGSGSADALGVAMALGAGAAYAAYVLACDAVAGGASPLAFAASVSTGAAIALLGFGAATGRLTLSFPASAWIWIAGLALVSTVLAISTFLAGLRRVGPSTAAIISTVEPPFTVALAALCFGESLAPLQLAGGAMVVGAVALLQLQRSAASSSASTPADSPVALTSVRQSASSPPAASHARVSATVSATSRTATDPSIA
jgi:drug/metabolite transporter (DMT)-like permease